MLVETQIRFAVPGLDPAQLVDAVAHACQAMTEARRALQEPVSFQDVVEMKSGCIRFCFRGLRSHAEMEFVYDRSTGELFAYNATYSHVDLDSTRFLRPSTKLDTDPGF